MSDPLEPFVEAMFDELLGCIGLDGDSDMSESDVRRALVRAMRLEGAVELRVVSELGTFSYDGIAYQPFFKAVPV